MMKKKIAVIYGLLYSHSCIAGSVTVDYNLKLQEPTCITSLESGVTNNMIIFPKEISLNDFDANGLASTNGVKFVLKLSKCSEDKGRSASLEISGNNVSNLFRSSTESKSTNTGFYLKYKAYSANDGYEVDANQKPFIANIGRFTGVETTIPFWVGVKKIDNNEIVTPGVLKSKITFNLIWE
ncbi:hypothetical protein M7963_22970 [Enterobacter roggenkampii]|uniref:fimbrial protein n=1 Tax=Enterobacter roggenkampii TaxID=1812935 RepID=UPI00223707DE|nr:hypothetical protein [Enterobacter roggenkampii]MCW5004354.1 hypothetical protein [Enterobacter roggenkampii]